MKRASALLLLAVVGLSPETSRAQLPGSMELVCDVDRVVFRAATRDVSVVSFRFWDAEVGGNQCGPDYVVPASALTVFKAKTDRFDGEMTRRFASIRAVLGTDAAPIELCVGQATWVDVSVGSQTLTCDFSAKIPEARKRLQSVPFAQVGQGPQGPQGPEGPSGPQGVQGPQGDVGPVGPQGVAGPVGPVGPAGPAGAPGATGANGISCWDLNENGQCDVATEDTNLDTICSVADCGGASGGSGQSPFGDGSDGQATIAVNASLSRDTFYESLTVNNGVVLSPNGYRIFVRQTLLNNGVISAAGGGGGNGGDGTVSYNGAGGGGSSGMAAYASGSLPVPPAGKAGSAGGGGGCGVGGPTAGSPGSNGTAGDPATKSLGVAGSGGGGGGSGGSGAGAGGGGSGSGGSAGTLNGTVFNLPHSVIAAFNLFDTQPTFSPLSGSAGSGSGGGGGGGGGQVIQPGVSCFAGGAGGGAGGSGAAGGVVEVFARSLVNNGMISVAGGDGGHGGQGGSPGGAGAGGGGGGGGGAGGPGGVVILIYGELFGAGSVSLNGGVGGSGGAGGSGPAGAGAPGVIGANGMSGSYFAVPVAN